MNKLMPSPTTADDTATADDLRHCEAHCFGTLRAHGEGKRTHHEVGARVEVSGRPSQTCSAEGGHDRAQHQRERRGAAAPAWGWAALQAPSGCSAEQEDHECGQRWRPVRSARADRAHADDEHIARHVRGEDAIEAEPTEGIDHPGRKREREEQPQRRSRRVLVSFFAGRHHGADRSDRGEGARNPVASRN